MIKIVDNQMIEKKEPEEYITPDKNFDIMEQIMVDPAACLNDKTFMLNHIVNNGFHASLLLEQLGMQTLIVEIYGQEYKMFYMKPHPKFDHSDVMFETEKFKNEIRKKLM